MHKQSQYPNKERNIHTFLIKKSVYNFQTKKMWLLSIAFKKILMTKISHMKIMIITKIKIKLLYIYKTFS